MSGVVRAGALALAVTLLAACGPPADAPWAPPVGSGMPAATAPSGEAPSGPLRLLRVLPEPGSEIEPRVALRLFFDRPVVLPPPPARAVIVEYPNPRAAFVEDPFRLTAVWLTDGGRLLQVQPPVLLTGREVRVLVPEGALRGADGSALERDPAAPAGFALQLTYRVMELPP